MNSSTAARNGDEEDGPFPFRKSMNCLTDCCCSGVSEPMTSARCSAAMVTFQLQYTLAGFYSLTRNVDHAPPFTHLILSGEGEPAACARCRLLAVRHQEEAAERK